MATEKSSSKGQAWFCTTGLPSDIVIEVDDMSFHLHKFPLMSKSKKLHQLITEQETKNPTSSIEQEEEEDNEIELHITLQDFPGSSETFELAAKFCYGVKFELTSSNVVSLRCAGEFLEMAEDYSENNLISRTETFLTQSVLKSVKESVKTLKSCEAIMSLAETIDIPQRLIDSIAARASSTDPSLFGWPINEGSSEANQILWNGIDTGARRKKNAGNNNADSWFEDLALLSLPLYKRLISAMKAQDLSSEIVENSLIIYAKKSIPGLSRSTRKLSSTSSMVVTEAEQRELIETIITNLPLEKNKKRNSSSTSTTTGVRHLFGLLRTANILNVSESCRTVLEQKIALRLENASLDDLLIPSYSYLIETLYDVECVERILGYYLDNLGEGSVIEMDSGDLEECGGRLSSPVINPVMLVGKLFDGYLSEIASDANLKPQKFYDLAVALPDQARLFDDGLYRAVDVYLKAHPGITEEEKEKICGVLDCQKLTLEACTHAAQNERLPLRTVVQVLFFEQLQLRNAIAGSLLAADLIHPESARPPLLHLQQQQHHEQRQCMELVQDNNTWNTAIRENQVLRLDMDSMRSRVYELERECSTMKKVIKKIDQTVSPDTVGWRSTLVKKFGCKFKTQVCDSHERTVVEAKKGRHNRNSSIVLFE